MAGWFSLRPDGALVTLRVIPNAGRDAIEGLETRADGNTVLKLRVAAIADKGRANAAVTALLAKRLNLPRTALTLKSGATARTKVILVAGDPRTIAARLSGISDTKDHQ